MKSVKSLILAGALLSSFASSAFAGIEYIHVVGAPAYRQDSNYNLNAFVTSLGGTISASSGPTTNISDVESASANQWYIHNTSSLNSYLTTAGDDLEIDADFSGSTAGFEAVSSGGAVTTLSGTVTTLNQKFFAELTSAPSGPPTLGSSAYTVTYVADFTLSDTFQATTPFSGTKTFYSTGPSAGGFTATFAALTPGASPLAVEPYYFVASPGAAAAGLTNITTNQAADLYHNGSEKLSFFTGRATDSGTTVYALARDGGSGARLVVQTEIGLGAAATLKTYQPSISGGSADSSGNFVGGTVTANALTAAEETPSTYIYAAAGNGGYKSFGVTSNTPGTPSKNGLLQAITATPLANTLYVTYLNTVDGGEAVAAGSSVLSYNGITYSQAALDVGQYTFWSYQNLFLSASPTTQGNAVANWLESNWIPVSGVAFSNTGGTFNVSRTADGGFISFGL